jgi:hypothetical protein
LTSESLEKGLLQVYALDDKDGHLHHPIKMTSREEHGKNTARVENHRDTFWTGRFLMKSVFAGCLSVVVFVASSSFGALAQDKNAAEKMSTAEMESLFKQLGSDAFEKRQRAFQRLRETPHALRFLQGHLKDSELNLEARRRLELLVNDAQMGR